MIRLRRRSAALAAYRDEDAMPYAGEGERAIPADAAAGARRAVGTCKYLGTKREVSAVYKKTVTTPQDREMHARHSRARLDELRGKVRAGIEHRQRLRNKRTR